MTGTSCCGFPHLAVGVAVLAQLPLQGRVDGFGHSVVRLPLDLVDARTNESEVRNDNDNNMQTVHTRANYSTLLLKTDTSFFTGIFLGRDMVE